MAKMFLPKNIHHTLVPPIKCQGIKTKLVPFIANSISWDGRGRWVEPFCGSCVTALNLMPPHAILSDTNPHLIRFYKALQDKTITPSIVRGFLEEQGELLRQNNGGHYYEIRSEFNKTHDPLLFLFLNRASYNGLLRFNSKGGYNVPYNHKPNRFSKAYITKICNQVERFANALQLVDWEFICAPWEETMAKATAADFVYLDPPYVGRHTDYFNKWTEQEANELAHKTHQLSCGFAFSMWLENKYRRNEHVDKMWANDVLLTFEHFYHIGASENQRNPMTEALLVKPGFEAQPERVIEPKFYQTSIELFLEAKG